MGLFTRTTPATAPAGAGDAANRTPGTPGAAGALAPGASGVKVAPVRSAPVLAPPPPPPPLTERQIYLMKLKTKVHAQLVEKLDVQNLRTLPAETVRGEV